MNRGRSIIGIFAVGLVLALITSVTLAQDSAPEASPGTAFTYQGRLEDAGGAVNDTCDFQFSLFNAASGGTQIDVTETLTGVEVSDGLFAVQLDFGAGAFNGWPRWLEIEVRCPAGSGGYVTLSPRQALTPAPYALYAAEAGGGGDITAVNAGTGLSGGGDSGSITLSADTGYLQRRVTSTCAAGSSIRVIKADGTVTCEADDESGAAGWSLSGNASTTPGTHFLGTTDNKAVVLKVNGQQALRIEPNSESPNLVGGFSGNSVSAGVVGATIAGGGNVHNPNRVTADYATVGGGRLNDATGIFATVPGGVSNEASGDYATVGGGRLNDANAIYAAVGGGYGNDANAIYAAVGGGCGNDASHDYATVAGGYANDATATYAAVGGGYGNAASGNYATVGGGNANDATGDYATVPGGFSSEASGQYSFAAGVRAKATHKGSFVLADSTRADFASVREDALRVRFNGGATFVVNDGYWVRFYSNAGRLIDTSTDAHLTTGGAWTNGSDREAKENFAPVDGQAVLARLAAVPIQTWNYKSEDPAVRRMGPTAQEFYAAFGLGEDERHISTIDADGVALAAIQGLHQLVQEKEAQIADLEARIAALESLVLDLAQDGQGGRQ